MKIDSIRRRVENHDFPSWEETKPHQKPLKFMTVIGAALVWTVVVFLFLFFWYVKCFEQNVQTLLGLFKTSVTKVPLILSLIVILFFFPVSLVVIILGLLVSMLKN